MAISREVVAGIKLDIKVDNMREEGRSNVSRSVLSRFFSSCKCSRGTRFIIIITT